MDDNKKLICAAAGAIAALAAVSVTVFAVKQHKKKQNALLFEELDCSLDDDLAELANEVEETKPTDEEKAEPKEEPKAEAEEKSEEQLEEETEAEPVAEEKPAESATEKADAPAKTEE